jgi:hypothetical protein
MKPKVIIGVVIILVLFLILVGCKVDYSDEEIEAEMENLTDDELSLIINEANQSEALTGEAQRRYSPFYKKYQKAKFYKISPPRKFRIAKRVLTLRSIDKDGCYLKINDEKIWLTSSKNDCRSLFLAESFVGRQDLYKLFEYFGYTNINKEKVLDLSNSLSVYFKKNGFDYFSQIENKFSSTSCKEISFFGVKTFCFNEIPLVKENNLKYVIKYLTVLKYTSKLNHENLLTDEITNAYSFVLNNEIIYYDGSSPESYGENIVTIKCEPDQGSANFQNVDEEDRVYICEKMMTDNSVNGPQRLFSASIIYHEAVHKYQQSHSYDIKCNYELTQSGELQGGKTGDRDFRSVYGAHINLLFSMSQNNILTCDYRIFAFDKAEELMNNNLCQVPNKPSHGYQVSCS